MTNVWRFGRLYASWFCSRVGWNRNCHSPVRGGRPARATGIHPPVCKGHPLRGFVLSIRLQNAVVENAQVKGGEYLLLLILSRYAADDGSRVFPSVSRLAKDTRQHPRNVQRQLRSLEAKGLIVRVGVSHHSTTNYRIAIEKLGGGAAPSPVAKSAPTGGNSIQRDGATPSDSSVDSSLNRQPQKEKVNFKTGDEALAHIWTFLPKPADRESP